MFLKGKPMHFEVQTANGEPLIKLPLPNDEAFKPAFDVEFERARSVYKAQNPDGILGEISRAHDSSGLLERISRFFR